jgi:rSAM/selenodomain-associated transferase 1
MNATPFEPTDRIILFLKSFRAGHAKTRLADRLGDRGALEIYSALVADLLAKLKPLRDLVVPYFDRLPDSKDQHPAVSSLLSRGLLKVQRGEDLGQRMSRAFEEVFAEGAERAVLIGSDIPQIDADLLGEYFSALRRFPVVLGPAADGGYYLIGFQRKRFDAAVFRGIEWSTEGVLRQSLQKVRSLDLPCWIGAELLDIDTIEDLESLVSGDLLTGSLAEFLTSYLLMSTGTSDR